MSELHRQGLVALSCPPKTRPMTCGPRYIRYMLAHACLIMVSAYGAVGGLGALRLGAVSSMLVALRMLMLRSASCFCNFSLAFSFRGLRPIMMACVALNILCPNPHCETPRTWLRIHPPALGNRWLRGEFRRERAAVSLEGRLKVW